MITSKMPERRLTTLGRTVRRVGLTLLEIRSDREGTPPVSPEQVPVNRSPAFPALVVTYGEEP